MLRKPSYYEKKQLLAVGSFLVAFSVAEICIRCVDPFPHFSPRQINSTEHGNATEFDPELGWRGKPNGETELVTANSATHIANNSQGFRDIEHDFDNETRAGILFLGDSFTAGHEVEQHEMFVSGVRERLPDYAIFNVSHRGYGTDQELLAFREWDHYAKLERVILCVCENDIDDNNSNVRSLKYKPRFISQQGRLVLTGVPVPRVDAWDSPKTDLMRSSLLRRSHFYHSLLFTFGNLASPQQHRLEPSPDMTVTELLLAELNAEVRGRGAELCVVFLPSKGGICKLSDGIPFQVRWKPICDKLRITSFDFADALEESTWRVYFRFGIHFNAHGHKIAAREITRFIRNELSSPE